MLRLPEHSNQLGFFDGRKNATDSLLWRAWGKHRSLGQAQRTSIRAM